MIMRAVLIVLILAVLVIIAGIVSGFIDITQIRGAQAPEVSAPTTASSPRAARRRRSTSRRGRWRSARATPWSRFPTSASFRPQTRRRPRTTRC